MHKCYSVGYNSGAVFIQLVFFSLFMTKLIKNLILLTYVGVNGFVLTNTSVRLDLLSMN